MKRFRCLRPFALLLSLLMLIYAFPFAANALPTTDAPDTAAELPISENSALTDVLDTVNTSGVREVTDLREENVKHFALSDGTYTAVTYPSPVHRKDESGNWQDIDNSLSIKAVKNTERYTTNDMRVSFSKAYTDGEALFALTENGYTIQMVPLLGGSNTEVSVMAITPSENKTVTVTNTEKRIETQRFDTIEEAAAVNNKSSIVYENVKTNTDLEYVLDGNNVKENIIVKSAGGSYVYRFTLSLTGLSATLLPSGDISLTDSETGAEKYTIPAPYMYDADGVLSYDVHYTLTPLGSGSYTLTVTASSEWMNAEDRAFPVTIDPTVTQTTQFMDTYIYSTAPNANYGSISLLPINDDTIIYSMWGLPSLPSGAIITNASLHMMPINVEYGEIWIGSYQMLETFYSSSITWNSAASTMTNFGMASTPMSTTHISTGAVFNAIDVTDAAKGWYSGYLTNCGVALKKLDGDNDSVLLYSYEAISEKRSYFTVEYILLENGTYFIQNVATGRYMDVEGPSTAEGATIQEWSFHGKNQSKWNLINLSGNKFRIQSVYSNRYIRGYSSTNSITQTSTQDTYSLWAIEITASGNYKFVCEGLSDSANTLSVPSSTSGNGADLVITSYTNDWNYCDEWRLYPVIDADYLGTVFDFWNSDGDKIGYFPSSPTIYLDKIDSSSTFYFEESVNTAISQWNNALPISVSKVNNSSTADIMCYGLTASDYKSLVGSDWNPSHAGLTLYSRTLLECGLYDNKPVYIYRINTPTIYLLSNNYDLAKSKMIATHELGHALGYFGHSTTATDVMFKFAHSNYQLSSAEIAHLLQCYEAFFD